LAVTAARSEEEYVTELRHVPEGWLAVAGLALVVALCWAVAWMYRSEGRIGASPRVRALLATIRCIVIVALAIIVLEPVRVRVLRRWIDSYTLVLVDSSSSMDIRDTYRDAVAGERVRRVLDRADSASMRRTDVLHRLLERDDRRFLRELARRNRVTVHKFSDEPRLLATIRATREEASATGAGDPAGEVLSDALDASVEATAVGPATNIERAVRRTVDALGSAPAAAVIVLSDGGFNQGASAEHVARYAHQRRLPIHVVGIGDPSPPRNVRIAEVAAPTNVFTQDPFSITARVSTEGLEGGTVRVELRERGETDAGAGRTVGGREVVVGPGGDVPVSFEHQQERLGRFTYTVETPVLSGESVTEDNRGQTTVNVIDARTRVLLVAGGPSWDYRFVSRLLERDDTFDVSCWLQSADLSAVRDGNTIIDHLPATAEELFEYDVVILMDPDREGLDEAWCRLLDTMVSEYGGGLLYAAARPHTPALMRDRSLRPLHDLLPVTLDPEADLILNEIGHYQPSGAPVEIPSTAFAHAVMRQADDPASTRLVWQGIGDIHWHFPVRREKPVAAVLMRHGDRRMRNAAGGHVLAAVQYVGAGRTGFLAFDGTWRWRRHGIDVFDRFWVQLVRYLAEGKLLGGTQRGLLMTESDRYGLGEAVTVTARLLNRQYQPLRRDQVLVRWEAGDDLGEVTLAAQSDRPGWFEGRFLPEQTGTYRLSLSMAEPQSATTTEVVREFRVTRPNLEMLRPQMDRANLRTLAEQSFGGRYFEVDELDALPDLIPDLHEEIPVRSRPTTLWDNSVTLTLLLVLLSLEWAIRKWHRLL
jgi:hypothetical protein